MQQRVRGETHILTAAVCSCNCIIAVQYGNHPHVKEGVECVGEVRLTGVVHQILVSEQDLPWRE